MEWHQTLSFKPLHYNVPVLIYLCPPATTCLHVYIWIMADLMVSQTQRQSDTQLKQNEPLDLIKDTNCAGLGRSAACLMHFKENVVAWLKHDLINQHGHFTVSEEWERLMCEWSLNMAERWKDKIWRQLRIKRWRDGKNKCRKRFRDRYDVEIDVVEMIDRQWCPGCERYVPDKSVWSAYHLRTPGQPGIPCQHHLTVTPGSAW